jgi:hypothetical protein
MEVLLEAMVRMVRQLVGMAEAACAQDRAMRRGRVELSVYSLLEGGVLLDERWKEGCGQDVRLLRGRGEWSVWDGGAWSHVGRTAPVTAEDGGVHRIFGWLPWCPASGVVERKSAGMI